MRSKTLKPQNTKTPLQDSLRRRQFMVLRVAPDAHFYGFSKCFKNGFDFMVFVLPFSADVEVAARSIGKGLEKMVEHLGWHVANFFALESSIPHQPGAAAEIYG